MNARILKSIISSSLALLIFCGAFYLGGGFKLLVADKNQDIEQTGLSNNMPRYRDKRFLPMGNKISVNNLPMELGYFVTKDGLSDVRDVMLERFKDSGYNPQYNHISEEEGFIRAMDKKTGEQKIVILKRVGDETLVFAGITPAVAENLIVKPDKSLGIPSDAINYIEVKNDDYGRYARTISFQLRGQREKNLVLFKERLLGLGFEENEHFKKIGEENIFAFSNDKMQIMVVVMESEDEKGEIMTSFVMNVMEKKDE